MATLMRCQVTLNPFSGLPKDAVNNVFHIYDGDATTPSPEPIAEAVRDFYTTGTLSTFLGRQIANTGHTVKVYRYDVATGNRIPYEGAPPDHVEAFDFVGRTLPLAGTLEPAEVALVLTLTATTPATVPLARRRGRLYFGPITEAVLDKVSADPAPTNAAINALTGAAQALENALDLLLPDPGDGWVVYSRPYAGRGENEEFRANGTPLPALPARAGAVYPIDQVSVDNAMDTQRRRGRAPTVRTIVNLV